MNENKTHNIDDIFKNIVNSTTICKIEINQDEGIEIIYNKSLVDIVVFNEFFYKKIIISDPKSLPEIFAGIVFVETDITIANLIKNISGGNLYLYFSKLNLLYKMVLPKIPNRSITESTVDPTDLYGSKDGLIENIRTNISLLERRLKTNKLKIIEKEVGKFTKTDVAILYLEGTVRPHYIKKVEKIIDTINIESLKTVDDIASSFNNDSFVPLVCMSSSPEKIANSLLNGRFTILIDNFPIGILLPVAFNYFTNLPDEISGPKYHTSYERIITFILIFISVFFLGLYVALINYHSNSLSMVLISEIKVSIKGSTLPLIGEILFIILTFEFLKMASLRIPSGYIQNMIIMVGGLLIGQNTVSSGFVSPFNLVITSFCYLATYGVTNNKYLITSLSLFRLFILFFSLIAGLYGFLLSSIIILVYLYNQKSLDITFLSPITYASFKNMFSRKAKEKSKVTL